MVMRFHRDNKIVAILQWKPKDTRIQEHEDGAANVSEQEAKISSDRPVESLHMQLVKGENSGEDDTKTRNNSTAHVKAKDFVDEVKYQKNKGNSWSHEIGPANGIQ